MAIFQLIDDLIWLQYYPLFMRTKSSKINKRIWWTIPFFGLPVLWNIVNVKTFACQSSMKNGSKNLNAALMDQIVHGLGHIYSPCCSALFWPSIRALKTFNRLGHTLTKINILHITEVTWFCMAKHSLKVNHFDVDNASLDTFEAEIGQLFTPQ